jgi:hypothetical protein
MMDIKIANSVKGKTTKCERDFKCLSGDTSCMCEVIDGEKFPRVEIKSKLNLPCVYRLSLGTLHYCLCPTRNEIYKNYHL